MFRTSCCTLLALVVCACAIAPRQDNAPRQSGGTATAAAGGSGQPPSPGAIVAHVILPSRASHEGIPVRVIGPGGENRSASTNACGFATFDGLPPGSYSVFASAGGKDGKAQTVAVTMGADTGVALQVPSPAVAEHPACTKLKEPVAIAGPAFGYTDEAIRRHIEGCIVIKCVISVVGWPYNCHPLQMLPELTDVSMNTAQRRRYSPAECDGKPVEVDWFFHLNYRIPR